MNKSLRRKVIYVSCIVGLLLPLYALGQPKNGSISQMRNKYRIGQTYLGQPDPASEGMRLATLGMRGIAASILWLKADYYKENKYYDRFAAALKQIALLQPHFISVWQHQAHNLSYNVAPTFDDYRLRYAWIKKGIDYLVTGTKYNEKKPILLYDLGHYVGHKIGKADEHLQYRSMFRKDKEFHDFFIKEGLEGFETKGLGYDQNPDNWRVGRLWFDSAVSSFQRGNRIAKTPHLLYSYGPLWIMYYGEAMQEEGILNDSTQLAWDEAGRLWREYGMTDIPWSGEGYIRLGEIESSTEIARGIRAKFDELSAEPQRLLRESKLSRLPDELKEAFAWNDADIKTQEQYDRRSQARSLATPSLQEIVAECPKAIQPDLLRMVNEINMLEERLRITNIYRSTVNYDYWEERAQAEQMPRTVEARRTMFEATKMINAGDPEAAIRNFETSFELWNKTLRRFPRFAKEEVGDEVLKAVNRYKRLLETELDESFPLAWFVEYRNSINVEVVGDDTNPEMELKFKEWALEQKRRDELEESGELDHQSDEPQPTMLEGNPVTEVAPPTEAIPPKGAEPPVGSTPPAKDDPPKQVEPPAQDDPPKQTEPPAQDDPPKQTEPPAQDDPPAVGS
jgi:hypothetical protein